ncbi:MAG TPA: rod shape-determining protein MreC [Candidatus Woesebacteria bacterium]|mgnify:FL=1|nr:rod shape-determining protein MreC [Candidatus Woesebacteria bacterium]HOA12236.1 rod shape-determining protein MreC [Candidatus Woesebacteria bacterium]HOI05368.1 rod shape-determining protein MreC [Candidatus Woesebacteria bacterium]HOP38694.1 rod shape-determining protein MreC [Candidatus Woesebacteria bacterium]HPA62117.1 rod shape-determining protein MreC [Candidatus Woesebacteria bacterium]
MFNYQKVGRYFLIIVVLVFIFLLDFLGLLALPNLRRLAINWQAANYRAISTLVRPVTQLKEFWQLRQRLEDLEYRYREASVQLTELAALREENQALRALLENSDRALSKNLITKPISSFAKPVLAIGSDSGLQVGSLVLGEGNLLGIVEEVSQQQARVLLLKNMLEQGIVAKTESGVMGIVKGDGRNILLTEVASEETLNLRERVVTVGQEGIPPDIFIGRIISLKEINPAKSTQEAILQQDVNFYELSLVEVQP